MEKRYMDRIQERAEEFAHTGRTKFARWELVSWFDIQRVSKSVWRTLDDHFKSMDQNAEPVVFDDGVDYLVLDRRKLMAVADKAQ